MRLCFLLAASLLACASASALSAQAPVLRPGDADLAPEHITARADSFDLYLTGGGPEAALTTETVLARVEGRDAIVRRETVWLRGQAAQVDSFALARESLEPILLRSEGLDGARSVDFDAGRARGWTREGNRRRTVDAALEERVFLSSSMDLLLGALPLREGYAARLATFQPGEGLATARVQVQALEEVATPAGPVRAWRVRVRGTGTAGTYWIQEDTRSLVQFVSADRGMRIVRRGGGPGGRMAAR